MKNSSISIIFIAIMIFTLFSCEERKKSDTSQSPVIANTPEEAALAAKADLLEVLKSKKDIKLGIDPVALEKAQPAPPIKQVVLDFEKLLSADSAVSDINKLAGSESNLLIPFVSENKVEAVAEISKIDKGWTVAALANAKKTNDLSILKQFGGDSLIRSITLYEVPNLNATLYGVNRENNTIIYTDYGEKFNLRQGVPFKELVSYLREDAVRFQRQFGEEIKKKKLVK